MLEGVVLPTRWEGRYVGGTVVHGATSCPPCSVRAGATRWSRLRHARRLTTSYGGVTLPLPLRAILLQDFARISNRIVDGTNLYERVRKMLLGPDGMIACERAYEPLLFSSNMIRDQSWSALPAGAGRRSQRKERRGNVQRPGGMRGRSLSHETSAPCALSQVVLCTDANVQLRYYSEVGRRFQWSWLCG